MNVIDLSELEVYKCPGEKVRLGSDNDGGYLICSNGADYDCLLSCGVGDDSTFEEDFLKMYPNAVCYAFDGTLEENKWPSKNPKINYVAKNIGTQENDKETNLLPYIEKYNSIFLKMDIEGYEFPWITTMTRAVLKKIKQIVIEFHYPLHNMQNWNAFTKLNKTHWLVHLHPHNACGHLEFEYNKDKLIIPNLIECTYVLKDHPELSSDTVPSLLDQPTIKTIPEMALKGYPYNTL